MGHGLSMPESPMPVLALGATMPVLSIELLSLFERIGEQQFSYDATKFGVLLKVVGLPLFDVGHLMQCSQKPNLELPDWSYLIADIFHTWQAVGAFRKKPVPEALLLAGLFWSGAFLPMRWRLLAANQPPLVPTLGHGAGVVMAILGITQLAIKFGLIKKAPNGPTTMQQAGTFSGALFFVCTYVKLFQLIQARKTGDNVFYGQCVKCLATTMCSIGNLMGHGVQKTKVSGAPLWNLMATMAIASLLRSKNANKMV